MPLVSLISLTDDSVVFFEPLLAPDPGWGIFGLPPIQCYLEEGGRGDQEMSMTMSMALTEEAH